MKKQQKRIATISMPPSAVFKITRKAKELLPTCTISSVPSARKIGEFGYMVVTTSSFPTNITKELQKFVRDNYGRTLIVEKSNSSNKYNLSIQA